MTENLFSKLRIELYSTANDKSKQKAQVWYKKLLIRVTTAKVCC